MRGTTARGHKRARDKGRARARARARAFGRLSNCFGRGLTSSTRELPTAYAVLYTFEKSIKTYTRAELEQRSAKVE